MSQVDGFINRFHEHEKTDDTFQFGCCYWFAFILYRRFLREGAKIMYDQIENHFGTMIFGKVYDITGDVTAKYRWEPWEKLDDELLKARIVRDCIMF